MDFFSLPCTTCKAVLKVRSAAIVGKILACPKCGGMVLVKPPADWNPGRTAPEGPSTITATPPSWSDDSFSRPQRDAGAMFEDIDSLLSAPGNPAPPQSPKPAASKPAINPAQPASPKPAPLPASAPVAKDSPAAPQADWSADRPWRYWLLVGASGVMGVLLAVGVVAVALRMMRPNRDADIISTVLPAPATDEAVRPVEPPPERVHEDPPQDPSAPHPPAENPPAEPPPAEPPPVAPQPPEQPPAKPVDPLELTKPEDQPKPSRIFGNLEKFEALLNNTAKPDTAPEEAPAAAPLPMDTPEKQVAALPRPQPRRVNVTARLADPLPRIEADGVPLVDFLQLMSDLSTIPITLDPDGVSAPNAAVKFTASYTTVGQALAEAAKSVHLEVLPYDKGVVIGLTKTPRVISVPLIDLAAGDPAGPGGVLNLITETITPGVWGEVAGGPAITLKDDLGQVRHEPAVLSRVVDFTERLRVARGLPLKSKYDPKVFRLEPRTERIREKLATSVSLNFASPTPFTRILDRLGRAAGVRLIVDWRALDEAGWNPDAEALLAAEKSSFGEALDDLLSPMELAWRVIDDSTIQVLTPAALAARPDLEIYKLPDDVADAETAGRLIAALRRELGDDAFQDQGGVCQLRYDAASKTLIAVLPQDKQRRLTAALKQPLN